MKALFLTRFLFKLSILVLLVGLTTSFSSQTNSYFVQFRVMTIPDAETARMIDQKMGSKSGILDSRSDHVTSTYFCLLSAESSYVEEDFKAWFAKLGFEIACYTKGVQNVDVMVSPHVLKNCVDESVETQ